jgi:hypothetical protein
LNLLPLRKLLWIAAALAAMVLLAPVAAFAHEGGHLRPDAAIHVASHDPHPSGGADRAFAATVAQVSMAQIVDARAADDSFCTAGCCFGVGCCAGMITSEGSHLDPPARPWALVAPASRPLASAHLASLPEPPDALA